MDTNLKAWARMAFTSTPPTFPERAADSAPTLLRARTANPFISIIVPAHNEEGYLGRTLAALRDQCYDRFEIIVVANACSDQTVAIARTACDRLLVIPQPGISRARNLGAAVAQGDILIFLDADTVLQPDALSIVAGEFSRDYAAGTLKGAPDAPRLAYRLLYQIKNWLHSTAIHKGSIGVIICWRDFFTKSGGFEEDLHMRENSALIQGLLRYGKYTCLVQTSAVTSMRRYESRGFFRTAALWIRIWLQSLVGNVRNKAYEAVR